MRAKHRIFASRKGPIKNLRSVEACFFFASALNRGICTRNDRPNYRPMLKLNHEADEQVSYQLYTLLLSPEPLQGVFEFSEGISSKGFSMSISKN